MNNRDRILFIMVGGFASSMIDDTVKLKVGK